MFMVIINNLLDKQIEKKDFGLHSAFSKISQVRDDTDVTIRRKSTDPCPVVVAPWSAGAGLSFGRLTNFFSSWSDISP
uniref:Uncharacterized protein n=1 Tax=Romanomermis culicivorax TaxID=13658 RepID=A0A915K773_ROMCU